MKKTLSLQYKILLALEKKTNSLSYSCFLNKSEKGQRKNRGRAKEAHLQTHKQKHTHSHTEMHTYRTAEEED